MFSVLIIIYRRSGNISGACSMQASGILLKTKATLSECTVQPVQGAENVM